MARKHFFLVLLACLASWAPAQAQAPSEPSRGELLYSTHCLACHSTQLHWRDKQAAQNWTGLKAQVRHWQITTGLNWSENDITEVATYLNARFYQFPLPQADRISAKNERQSVKAPGMSQH